MPNVLLSLLFAALLLLSACGKKAPSTFVSPEDASLRWERYLTKKTDAPYRASLALRLGIKGDTRRVTALLWGNDTERIRLDVFAGVGTNLAKISSQPKQFILVAPVEEKAYVHEGRSKPLLKIGVPLPLTLANLADLVRGNFARVFGASHSAVVAEKDGLVSFGLIEQLSGNVSLDANGLLHRWAEGKDGHGWVMTVSYTNQGRPQRFVLQNERGQTAVVVVKELQEGTPFSAEQLHLKIPASLPIHPLTSYTAATK